MTRTDLISMQRGMIKAHEEQIAISEKRLVEVKEQLAELEPLVSHAKVLSEVKEVHEGNIRNIQKMIQVTQGNIERVELYMAVEANNARWPADSSEIQT
ncbi:MAG: hypothetical protein E3J46_12795 [Desulfobacteraceae bacterium]|nr:MAG: hypothetical protein E3J46_12795 [Desulfobacteraceae bacterium]